MGTLVPPNPTGLAGVAVVSEKRLTFKVWPVEYR